MQIDINYFFLKSVTVADVSEVSGSVLRHSKQCLRDYLQQSTEGEELQTAVFGGKMHFDSDISNSGPISLCFCTLTIPLKMVTE